MDIHALYRYLAQLPVELPVALQVALPVLLPLVFPVALPVVLLITPARLVLPVSLQHQMVNLEYILE